MRSAKVPLSPSSALQTNDHAVGEGAAVALVGVADDVFARPRRVMDGLPLDARGKARAAAAAQAGGLHLVHDLLPGHGHSAAQARKPAMGLVIVKIERVDHAAAGEGQPRLAAHPVEILGRAEVFCGAIQQRRGLIGRGAPMGDAARAAVDLHQRFQPDHAAAAGADHLRIEPARGDLGLQRCSHGIGAHGPGGAVAGDVDPHAPASASRASRRAASTRPWTWPLTITAGAQAQRPRQ